MMRLLTVLAATGLAAAACGGSGDSGESKVANAPATGSASQDIAIVSPANGANVTTPLTIKIKTKDPIGPLDSGKNHVHYIVDGKEDQYEVVTSDSHVINSLPKGKHTIKVTLQHADHSPIGPLVTISVNVTGGANGPMQPCPNHCVTTSPSSGSNNGGGGGNYGY